MTAVKITVMKRALHQDLAKELSGIDIKPCEIFADGQEFIGGFNMPEGFCAWAWADISKMVVSIMSGANFDRGPWGGWMKQSNTSVACCTDGLRPVTFKLERVETRDMIDSSRLERPAPREAYASERWGEFSYVFPKLRAGAAYRVRLHFCEIYHQNAGKRRFAVEAGGKCILEEFDIVAEAGGPYKAIVKEFDIAADARGALALRFRIGSVDNPKISAIEILEAGPRGAAVYAVNSGGGARGDFAEDAYFEGGNAVVD